ncbi:MAG: DMT family transporter [Lachnospiraceae bacterium]|nr:DMT family transporter [Lachnospiraceae bacterium]MDY5540185.1 DMT family transporter [Lachnospiraceae bacterium]
MICGLLSVIAASILFGFLPGIIKILQSNGLPDTILVGMNFTFSFLFYAIITTIQRKKIQHLSSKSSLFFMLFSGLIGMGLVSSLLTSSYHYIPTGTATLIHFTYPVIVTLLMIFLFHESFSLRILAACILSICGMMFITDFSFSSNGYGILLSFLSGIFYALYIIMNDKANFSHLHLGLKMMCQSLGAILLSAVQIIFLPVNPFSFSPIHFFLIAVCGLINGSAFLLLTYGIKKIGSSKAAFACMLEPVTSVLCGVLFFHDRLKLSTLTGILLILISMIMVQQKKSI